jgi:predicted adenine nucleotide alpha hydrolase (AANH) superfamily ATPase
LLLHSCCAPCEGEVLQTMLHSGVQPTVFFYNPNIHPKREYELRKSEDKRYCDKIGVEHLDADYDVKKWFDRVRGLEWEPERGARCTAGRTWSKSTDAENVQLTAIKTLLTGLTTGERPEVPSV